MPAHIDRTEARYGLVTAGYRFLLHVLPFRQPNSRDALTTFVAAAHRIRPSRLDLDFVLLRCLAVLSEHTARRIPSLIDQYLFQVSAVRDDLTRFAHCIESLLRYHAIGDGSVQEAMQFVHAHFARPDCASPVIAARLGLRPATLTAIFKRQVHCTLTEYIRDVRLDRAAILLGMSNNSIKEIWAQVGYSYHSTFDRDFKRKFGCSPREYRARAIRPLTQEMYGRADANGTAGADVRVSDTAARRVLIVDDDKESRTCVSRFLGGEGFRTFTAANGVEGLTAAACCAPDVILLDYRLGDIDGVEVLRQLREQPGGHAPGISLFTADWSAFDRADEVQALRAMIAYKLCDLDQIKDLVVYLSPSLRETGLASCSQPLQPI